MLYIFKIVYVLTFLKIVLLIVPINCNCVIFDILYPLTKTEKKIDILVLLRQVYIHSHIRCGE